MKVGNVLKNFLKTKILSLILIILLVPFVSAIWYDSILGVFSKAKNLSSWDPRYLGGIGLAIGLVVFGIFGWRKARKRAILKSDTSAPEMAGRRVLGFLWRHKTKPIRAGWWGGKKILQGGYYAGKGGINAGRRGWEFQRARRDAKMLNDRIIFGKRVMDELEQIYTEKKKVNDEETNLDRQLYKAQEYEKVLKKRRNEIEPAIINMGKRIARLQIDYDNGKFDTTGYIRNSLLQLWTEYIHLQKKHNEILQRYEGLIQAEEQLIIEKEKRRRREQQMLQEEIRDETGELINLKNEAKEAYDAYVALKKASSHPKDIRIKLKEFKKINKTKRNVRKGLWDAYSGKDDKAKAIEEKVMERLKVKQSRIWKIRQLESQLATNLNSAARVQSMNYVQLLLKELEKDAGYIKKKIRELAKIDRRNEKLEKKAERLNKIRLRYNRKAWDMNRQKIAA